MQKTLFVTHWSGGGVWGLKQLVQAAYIEDQTGMRMADLSDLHISSSIGALAANVLLVRDAQDPSKPKFRANELIEPFQECAEQLFGKDGIQQHYIANVQHDLRKTLQCGDSRVHRLASRVLSDRTGKLHKPHHILGGFLNNYLGDLTMDDLMKSSITQLHHMDKTTRSCFMALKPDIFDIDKWADHVLPNHGSNVALKDVIMATTAAPTVFNRYEVDGRHYVDLDHMYSPLVPVELAMLCMRSRPMGFAFQGDDVAPQGNKVHLTKISCGMTHNKKWDQSAYQNHGPLMMMRDLNHNAAIDQQRIDHEMFKLRYGAGNLFSIGADVSHLGTETEDLPSGSPFDGNRSNMRKIIGFAERAVVQQRDQIMRHAEFVVETRARENRVDPLAAFGAANGNVKQADVAPTVKGVGFLGGLRRRFAFRTPA